MIDFEDGLLLPYFLRMLVLDRRLYVEADFLADKGLALTFFDLIVMDETLRFITVAAPLAAPLATLRLAEERDRLRPLVLFIFGFLAALESSRPPRRPEDP